MFDTVNRLLWYVLISNSAEKTTSTDRTIVVKCDGSVYDVDVELIE